jgi:hypothetical protein
MWLVACGWLPAVASGFRQGLANNADLRQQHFDNFMPRLWFYSFKD